MNEAPAPFAAALIMGGQSRRMGRDKAWIDWHGEPLWQLQFRKLMNMKPRRLLVSCRQEQALPPGEAEMIFDPPDNQGPLPALARCLERAQMPVLALAVDMPHVSESILHELIRESSLPRMGAVFQAEHGYEPLCAIYPLGALDLLRDSLAQGNLRLQTFVQTAADAGLLHAIPLSKEQEALFLNLNTPADLA
jgi:molybdopterin-guanine dinucleotide biosynthesis protein A